MSNFLDHLSQRVLLCDGAMGTQVQARDLDIEKDYLGQENCTEILNKSRPDMVREIHMTYLAAGSDMVQTNSFGGSPITLGEFGLADEAHWINQRAAELGREAVAEFAGDGRTRFVLGSIGPGTRLPSLAHIGYVELEDAFTLQAAGLIDGGVDAILIETAQDPLQIKAAINGAKIARAGAKSDTPILVQATIETTGAMLVGADISAVATAIEAMDVDSLGLNCATGPQEMAEHVRWLTDHWPKHISVQPNAGLPELVDGQTKYPLGPDEITRWLERFAFENGVSMIGGCCGTTGPHIESLDAMLRSHANGELRPVPVRREHHWVPALASLYTQVEYRQENAYLSIGERCNANGSKKFRELQDAKDWDGCIAIAKDQEKGGSHALDVCTAFVGHDEVSEMTEVLTRMRGAVTVPLVIDSTEFPVLEKALALYAGKAVINSINFEDGEDPAHKRLVLAERFGAAVIALTIDEDGMAKDADSKLAVAKRLFEFATVQHNLSPSDLLFDPLTFTICTGNEDDRKLGLETLDAIERIAKEMPDCQIILGLSNISFGLNPPARHVLNSVYLDHALKRGMTGAIVHVSRIVPLHKIPAEEAKVAEDLIFDRRREGYDPLHAFMALFEDRKAQKTKVQERPKDVEERLKLRIVEGDRNGLEDDLDEAMKKRAPLDIINNTLLDGMKVVGELFGSGQLQLPFVLQSAETMKAAVAHLEPHMEKDEGTQRGTIVLATVRGDVHDIGKNLVDIILTNNGYKVVNLGIKQPVAAIMEAAREADADAVGMSGLLVKSTVVMRENLEEMTREGIDVPVFLGGAALTRAYVEDDCVAAYGAGRVAYARDAFSGLGLMNHVAEGTFDDHLAALKEKAANKPKSKRRLGQPSGEQRPVDVEEAKILRNDLNRDVDPPEPPFWGPKQVSGINVKTLMPYLNETMLFQFQWGYKKQGRSRKEFDAWAVKELRPIVNRMAEQSIREKILQPAASYGYWKAAAKGNDLILFDENGSTEVARFSLPRQDKKGGLCIADFVKDVGADQRSVVGLQVVTMGQRVSEAAWEIFEADKYQDYLYLHGFGIEMTEALAEYVHKRIRTELGFGDEEARETKKLLKQQYRGARYSFGYPACPNLGDQRVLLELLGAEAMGIRMADEDQLHPEQSTSALVLVHPQASYFSV